MADRRRATRPARQTTGGVNGSGLGPPNGPRGHGLVNPSSDPRADTWRVGCLCNWMDYGLTSEQSAIRSYDDHISAVQSKPAPTRTPRRSAESTPTVDALRPGSIIRGTLATRRPGWRLDRPDGMPLQVTVTGARPALLAGSEALWEIMAKNAGSWEIRPASR